MGVEPLVGPDLRRSSPYQEGSTERGGEERIAIMHQKPYRAEAVTQVYGEIAGLSHRRRTGRVRWSLRPSAASACRAR
jgi:hypothetical protein